MKLVCGEARQVYPPKSGPRGPYRGGTTKTTVTVAKILKAKYNIFETFFDVYYDQILEALAESHSEELEFQFNGTVRGSRGKLEERVGELFREFIESGNAGRVGIPGTPTAAAVKARRPSFWDTGLFKDNARFWLEQ